MDNNSFGAIISFAGVFLLMGFDYAIGSHSMSNKNIAFLIPMLGMMVLGGYCGIKWMIEKRKIEKAS